MKNYFLLLFWLMFSACGFSQKTEEKNYWILKSNPTHAIDFFTFPTISMAAERMISPRISLNAEAGYQFYDFKNKDVDTVFIGSRGFKTNIEIRRYWGNKKGFYNAVQAFYRHNQFTRTVSYTKKNASDGDAGFTDNFGVEKSAAGVLLIIGYQYVAPFNVVFETYFGGGYMNRRISNTERQYDEDYDEIIEGVDQQVNRAATDLSEASGHTVMLTIGLRVGYKF